MQDSTAARIQVEVLNGCGVSGVAEKLTDHLRSNNIDVVNLGNYRSFEIENSVIIGRNEKIHNAEIVAAIVGLDNQSIIQQINPDDMLDVTFILGKDYKRFNSIKKEVKLNSTDLAHRISDIIFTKKVLMFYQLIYEIWFHLLTTS